MRTDFLCFCSVSSSHLLERGGTKTTARLPTYLVTDHYLWLSGSGRVYSRVVDMTLLAECGCMIDMTLAVPYSTLASPANP